MYKKCGKKWLVWVRVHMEYKHKISYKVAKGDRRGGDKSLKRTSKN